MNFKNYQFSLSKFIIFLIILSGCNNQEQSAQQSEKTKQPGDTIQMKDATLTDKIVAGSICIVDDGDGKFGIIKVLVIDDEIAHVRIYKNKYDHRPAKIDLTTLSLGSMNDKDGFGIGHTPLARKGFDDWNPVVVAFQKVTEEELEGYEIWRSQ